MDERVILQWNLPNWITVFLMAMAGYTILSAGSAFFSQKFGSK